MTTPSGDPHDLLAGYLLDALDPEEEARFVAHLPTCAVCAAELASLGETVADLAESYHVVPPPTVEARLLSTLFPEENVDPEPAPVTATAERRPRRWVPFWSSWTPGASRSSSTAGPCSSPPSSRGGRSSSPIRRPGRRSSPRRTPG